MNLTQLGISLRSSHSSIAVGSTDADNSGSPGKIQMKPFFSRTGNDLIRQFGMRVLAVRYGT